MKNLNLPIVVFPSLAEPHTRQSMTNNNVGLRPGSGTCSHEKTCIKPAADRIEAIAAMKVCPHSPFPGPPIVEHTLVVRINFSKIFKLCAVCLPVSNFSLLVLSTVESHTGAPSAQRPPNVAHHASSGRSV